MPDELDLNQVVKDIEVKEILESRKNKLSKFWWKFGQIIIGLMLFVCICLEYYIIFLDGKCYKNPCYYADKLGYICMPLK